MADQNSELVRKLKALRTNLPYFMREVLKIKSKTGEIIPFVLNATQAELHKQIEQQKATTGKVRVLILKGRQQGCSTYVSGRYYQKGSLFPGKSIFIMAHDKDTT